jgi:hypothetical protein
MKEETGKTLLQPSFKQQQQQTQHIKNNKLNNNMTNKHEQQQKRRTSTMAGLPISTNFSRLQKDNKPRRRRRRATSTFSTLHPILKRSKKEPILPTFEKKSTNQLRRYNDVNTILHSAVHTSCR